MTFKDLYLFEREDENILSKVTPEAERLYKGTVSGLKKLFNKIFFSNKGSEGFSGYDRPFMNFTFNNLKFRTSSDDNSVATYSPQAKSILIRDTNLISYLKKVDTIVDALQNIDEPKMVEKFKLEAKVALEQFFRIFSNIKTTLAHELVHKYDDEVNKIFSTKYYNKIYSQMEDILKLYNMERMTITAYQKNMKELQGSVTDYYNRDSEVNAYWLQSLYNFLEDFKDINNKDYFKSVAKDDFQSFKRWYVGKYLSTNYKYWNEDNKRRFIKRLYDFYTKFLQKIKEENK